MASLYMLRQLIANCNIRHKWMRFSVF